MQGEYPVPIELKVLRIGIAAIIATASMALFPAFLTYRNGVTLFFSVSLLIAALYLIISSLRRRILVSENSITAIDLFTKTEITIPDIKGIRQSATGIAIVPMLSGGRTIMIPKPNFFDESKELRDWLESEFADITEQERQEELDAVLSNPELGRTEEQRSEKLKKARELALTYNIGPAVVFVLSLSWRDRNIVPFLLGYPLLGTLLIGSSKGLVRFNIEKDSPFTNASIGIMLSVMIAYAWASVRPFYILSFAGFWLPFFMVSMVMFALLFLSSIRELPKLAIRSAVVFCILSCGYGFAAVTLINCAYDGSTGKRYKAMVINQYVTHGKHDNYYLRLDAWGPRTRPGDIDVSRAMYDRVETGSSVTVHLKQGVLHVSWFFITPPTPTH